MLSQPEKEAKRKERKTCQTVICWWNETCGRDIIASELTGSQTEQNKKATPCIGKKPVIKCVCRGHRDKIKVPDPVVKDLISKKIVKQII